MKAYDEIQKLFSKADEALKDMRGPDLFAMGCYLLQRGKDRVGVKLIKSSLKGRTKSAALIRRIVMYATKLPVAAVEACQCHSEIHELFPELAEWPYRPEQR